jgi:CBS domain containing-hemolysin-like protein
MSDASGSSTNGAKPTWRQLFDRARRRWRKSTEDVAADVAEAFEGREARGELVDGAQRTMVVNAARFHKLRVDDVMTPKADIIAVEASASLSETATLFNDSQHSRLPIYRDTLDDPIGFVHVKDIVGLLAPQDGAAAKAKPNDRVLPRLRRDVLAVPPSMPLSALLLKMQSQRIHMAIVVDEYGGTDGLVTIEDIVEQIVGDIADEHDEQADDLVQARPGGVFEVDGRADVAELEQALSAKLTLRDHDEDEIDTVAGLATALIGRVPERGEVLTHPAGFLLEVMEADPRRVRRLRVRPAPPAPRAEATA